MPVSCEPLPTKKLAVRFPLESLCARLLALANTAGTLPNTDTALTLANWDPLPRIKLPVTLAVVVTLPVSAAKLPVYVGK